MACTSAPEGPLLFAAASTEQAVEEALATWPEPVRVSFAASSLLGRQIEAGAPADAFLSAHAEWLDGEVFVRNTMVLVGEGEGCTLVADEHVPAGRYARDALGEDVELVSAPDAPATRAMYDRGVCPRAALYTTDAVGLAIVEVLETGPIEYPLAALTPRGEPLVEHLRARKSVFEAHGFQ